MIKTLLAKCIKWWNTLTRRSETKKPPEVSATRQEEHWKTTTSERGLQFQSELQDWIRRGGK